jgi:hypothetical protein
MERHTQYQKALENEDKVYEKTSVAFTTTDPQTKTLQLSPASGKIWHLDKIRAWTDMIGATYRSSGVAICCLSEFGQRLKITETTNGVYISATKTGSGTHTLYLEVEGTEL